MCSSLSASLDDDVFFQEAETHLRNHLDSIAASDSNNVAQGSTPYSSSPPSQLVGGADAMSQTLGRENPHNNGPAQGLAVSRKYDPFWVQNTGVDPRSVFEPHSNMKFETLFYRDVIQKGDCFVLDNVEVDIDGVLGNDVATLTVCSSSQSGMVSSEHSSHC